MGFNKFIPSIHKTTERLSLIHIFYAEKYHILNQEDQQVVRNIFEKMPTEYNINSPYSDSKLNALLTYLIIFIIEHELSHEMCIRDRLCPGDCSARQGLDWSWRSAAFRFGNDCQSHCKMCIRDRREYWAQKKGQLALDKENAAREATGQPTKPTKFETCLLYTSRCV